MKIGVVGAGISGLAISLAAEKAGHEVVIFESESDIGAVSYTHLRAHET